MQYSLLSRFQGAIAGVSLGSRLILSTEKSKLSSVDVLRKANPNSKSGLNINQYRLQGDESYGETKPLELTQEEGLVVQMTNSLIRCQGLEPVDWKQSWQQWQQVRDSRIGKDRLGVESSSKSWEKSSLSVAEVCLATLPIALLFHEQSAELLPHLQQGISVCQSTSSPELELEQAIFAFHLAIAFSLKEELDPNTLISGILNHLDPLTHFSQQLQQVQILVEQRVCLETAREQLLKTFKEKVVSPKANFTSVALAFFSFLSTPHDPQTALLRTLHLGRRTQSITILTGALSGSYNSFSGFPLSWQSQFKRSTFSSSQVQPEVQTRSQTPLLGAIFTQPTELFALWSGVYNTKNRLFEIHPTLTVAAPNVIRSGQS